MQAHAIARLLRLDKLIQMLGTAMIPILVVGMGLTLMVWDPLPMQGLRNSIFDQYQRWRPRVPTDAPVRIIDIDEDSIQRLGQWPWPRTRIAELVESVQQAGAIAIGFDVVFSKRPVPRLNPWCPCGLATNLGMTPGLSETESCNCPTTTKFSRQLRVGVWCWVLPCPSKTSPDFCRR